MFPGYDFKIILFVFCLILIGKIKINAQGINQVNSGETRSLNVIDHPGYSFFWRIYTDYELKNEATPFQAEFIEGNSGTNVNVKWNLAGNYYFTVQSFDIKGCTNIKAGKMEVLNSPLKAIAGANITIGSCQSCVLNGSKSTGDILNYTWKVLDTGLDIAEPNSKITYCSLSDKYSDKLPKLFRVRLIVKNKSGQESSDTVKIKIELRPNAVLVFSNKINNNGYYLADGQHSTGTEIKYDWSCQAGKIIGNSSDPTIAVQAPGNYSLLITDKYGCNSMVNKKIEKSPESNTTLPFPIIFPQGFSPNGDGLNDFLVFKGLENYPGSVIIIFGKDGQICFKSDNYQNNWDGRRQFGNTQLSIQVVPGVYYYSLKLGKSNKLFNGFIYITY